MRIPTTLLLAAALALGSATAASADDGDNAHIPATCDYQQYWTRATCGSHMWTVPDPRPKYVRVRRHMTLWHLAVVYYGNGYAWTTIQHLNHIRGTRIYVGQVLRIR
jgi:nucleoid-associated protein YgaU